MTKRAYKYVKYVAIVEGEEHGVPFQVFFKRMDKAEEVAIKTRALLIDLRTLTYRRWVAGEWREAI